MTKVTIVEKENGDIEFECIGHANYGEPGTDIVCAAVSVMCNTFANLCMELSEEKKIEIKKMLISPGKVGIIASDPCGFTIYPVKMLKIGFAGLSEEYPKNVRMCVG